MAPGTGDQERQALTRLVRRLARDAEDARYLLAVLGLLDAPAARPPRRGRPPVDRGHGHPTTYRKGCRCDDCRAANTADARQRRAAAGRAA